MAKRKRIRPAVAAATAATRPDQAERVPVIFWGILLLAFGVRLSYLLLSKEGPFYEPTLLDPQYYHQWALKILAGDWVGDGVFYGLPLYPFFLALCYKLFGGSLFAVKLIQLVLGLVSVFFIYKTADKIAGKSAGLWTAALAACYGPLFFHELILIPEALAVPLYSASFYNACVFFERPSARRGAFLGLLFGLAALTKAGIIPFVLIFSVMALFRRGAAGERKTLSAAAVLAVFLLTLAPVTAHNLIYGKDAVLLTSHAGFNFYIGNNPKAQGVFVAPEGTGSNVDSQIQDSRNVAERAMGRTLKPSEVSKYWSDKAWQFIQNDPGDFGRLCLRKFLLFFDAREISDVDDYFFGRNFNPLLKWPWVDFAWLGPLFLLGLAATARSLRHRALVYTLLVSYLAGLMAFFINARYRLPLLCVILPLGGAGIAAFLEQMRARGWVKLAWYAVVLALGVLLTQTKLVGTNWSRDYVNAGDVYQQRKDFDRAVEYYNKALAVEPGSIKANLAMGVVYTKMGMDERARDYYLKTIELDPDNSQATNNLGLWYDRQGDLEQAGYYFLKTINKDPASSQAHNNLGMVYAKMGKPEKAVEEFEQSLKLNPKSARANTNLGLVLHHLGRDDQARQLWEKALQIDPSFSEAKKALQLLGDRR